MNYGFENQGSSIYLVAELPPEAEVDTMTLGMITNNRIPGVAHALYTQLDTTRYVKFNITAKVSLKQLLEGAVNRHRLTGVFLGICNALRNADDYMLDRSSFLYDADKIFVNVSTLEVSMVCVPVMELVHDTPDVGMLFKSIMFSAQFDATENTDYVGKIINRLNNPAGFLLEDFQLLLEGLEAGAENPAQRPDEAVVPAERQAPTQFAEPAQNNVSGQNTVTTQSAVSVQNAAFPRGASPSQSVVPTQNAAMSQGGVPTQNAVMSQGVPTQNAAMSQGGVSAQNAVMSQGGLPAQNGAVNQGGVPAQNAAVNQSGIPTQNAVMNQGVLPGGPSAPVPQMPQPSPAAPQGKEKKGFSLFGGKAPKEPKPEKKTDIKGDKKAGGKSGKKAKPMANVAIPGAQQTIPRAVPQTQPGPQQTFAQTPPATAQSQAVMPQATIPSQNNQPMQVHFGETTVLGGGAAMGETTVLGANPAPMVQPYLIRIRTDEHIPLTKPVFRVGKEKSYVDYFVSDNSAVSRSHANFLMRDGRFYVMDTNSTNHTFVDNQQIESNRECEITHGMRVRLADEEFEFRAY
ncbi:MAG: FHA domain-containing protein [Lachnospiraceae bacterium]|nr:FHA domain-containing protein [Lachnospiraceae bacterium]